VSVWKDSRALGRAAARVAVARAGGKPPEEIGGARRWKAGPKRLPLDAILLTPVAITRENLDVVIDAGWVTKGAVCRGVVENAPNACR
jgi:D-xylose transport system substrate-binding protein